jgi:hypothetical protein
VCFDSWDSSTAWRDRRYHPLLRTGKKTGRDCRTQKGENSFKIASISEHAVRRTAHRPSSLQILTGERNAEASRAVGINSAQPRRIYDQGRSFEANRTPPCCDPQSDLPDLPGRFSQCARMGHSILRYDLMPRPVYLPKMTGLTFRNRSQLEINYGPNHATPRTGAIQTRQPSLWRSATFGPGACSRPP